MGNILETYDLILISLLSTIISTNFFSPASGQYTHIINVLYIFFISTLFRPVGNIIMGIFADRYGRKKIMIISLVCTGLGTVSVGLLPSYSWMGVWSTLLFIMLRIFQNFFAGIEYINSASYLIESSSKDTRGYYASWTAIGISGGYLLASIMALVISSLITKGFIPEWSLEIRFFYFRV